MSPPLRYCLVCETDAEGTRCETCGSETFCHDDPRVADLESELEEGADRRRSRRDYMVSAFVGGIPGALFSFFFVLPYLWRAAIGWRWPLIVRLLGEDPAMVWWLAVIIPPGIGVLIAYHVIQAMRRVRQPHD